MDKKDIEKEAKQILDKFAKALERIKAKEEISYVDRDIFEREEKQGKCEDSSFKKRILDNSPNHNNDSIIAEKGDWV